MSCRRAQAMVLTKEIHHSSKGGTSYSITYRFTTAQGRTLKGSGKVSFKVWRSLEERGPASVLYLPDKPSSNRVQGETNWFGSLIFIPFGSVFMLIGGIVFFFGLRNCLRRLRLSRDGLPAEGTVTAVEDGQVEINGQPQWVIRYRYNDHQGHSYEGESEYLSAEEAANWKVGDTGRLRFNPSRPKESTWEGKGDKN